ncbi:MAG TPA: hypothetical protein VN928_10010 [Myxococcales bacterium]|nr:hypothetical protein [Myxococcales bacterium]
MGLGVALAIALLSLPLGAAQGLRSFQVKAAVVRSARVQTASTVSGTSRLELKGSKAVAVQLDSAPAQLVAGAGLPLPPGTAMVTVHY